MQTFHITIRPVDDSLPVVHNSGMRVQEGVRKTITEFELKAVDADTEVRALRWVLWLNEKLICCFVPVLPESRAGGEVLAGVLEGLKARRHCGLLEKRN